MAGGRTITAAYRQRAAPQLPVGDEMIRSFALIAWPAEYGESGVMIFMISHGSQVFENELGPDGE
jgi:hypothetical protein